MKWLDGYKTIIGTIGFVICEGIKVAFPDYAQIAEIVSTTIFVPLGVWGIAHKIQKSGVTNNG